MQIEMVNNSTAAVLSCIDQNQTILTSGGKLLLFEVKNNPFKTTLP
jgi:hypothetical protein